MKRIMLVLLMVLCLVPVSAFSEETFAPMGNYRVFCADGLYGVQTLDGETVIPAAFAGIQPFAGDLCIVEGVSDEECCIGLWRLSTGEELLPCDYDNIEITGTMVIHGSAYSDEGRYGFRNHLYDPETGRMVLDDDAISEIWPLADGQLFAVEYLLPEVGTVTRVAAPDGTILLDEDCQAVDAAPTSNGIVSVSRIGSGDDERYYNTAAGQWLEGSYDTAWPFADGYAGVFFYRPRACYVIDETGAAVSPAYLDMASDSVSLQYGKGLFAVRQEDGWYVIRVSSGADPAVLLGPVQTVGDPRYLGNQVFALSVDEGTLLFSGADSRQAMLAGVSVDYSHTCFIRNCTLIWGHGKKGFLFDDLSVIEPAFDDCVEFLGDYGFVEIDGLWYPIDRSGHVDMSVSFPDVSISDDWNYYLIEYADGDVLCLNPDLEPISHRSFCDHG